MNQAHTSPIQNQLNALLLALNDALGSSPVQSSQPSAAPGFPQIQSSQSSDAPDFSPLPQVTSQLPLLIQEAVAKLKTLILQVPPESLGSQLMALMANLQNFSQTHIPSPSSDLIQGPLIEIEKREEHKENATTIQRRKAIKRLSSNQRLQVAVSARLQGNNTSVAREFGISEGAVRKCLKKFAEDEDFLRKVANGTVKRKPSTRTALFPAMELKLLEWIAEQRSAKLSVSMKNIQDKALQLHSASPEAIQPFSASKGWFCKFLTRHKLSRRTPTHVMQQMRESVVEDIKKFWLEIARLRIKIEVFQELGDVQKTLFLNIDEVPIFLDLSPRTTYHARGARTIEVKRTKGSKMLSTALLGVFHTGYKLPIYWVTKSAQKIEVDDDLKSYIIAKNGSSGWVDGVFFKDWLKRLLTNLILPEKTHLVLVLDQARIHCAQEVIELMNQKPQTSHFLVPSGCTFLLQPLDVGVNKPFKDRLRKRFDYWFKNEGSKDENKTPAGYFKPPPSSKLVRWMVEEFDAIPQEIIQKSFKSCGLGLNLDHSEDKLINPAIFDHLIIEKKLSGLLLREDPTGERQKLLEKLQSYEEILTYEPPQENLHGQTEEEVEEQMIIEVHENEENDEDFFEDYEEICKVRVDDNFDDFSNSITSVGIQNLMPIRDPIDGN